MKNQTINVVSDAIGIDAFNMPLRPWLPDNRSASNVWG